MASKGRFIVGVKHDQFTQASAQSLKAQWLSGIKLRLNEVKDKFGKLNQVIVIKVKAQWLSGLNLRLNDLLETYSTVRG